MSDDMAKKIILDLLQEVWDNKTTPNEALEVIEKLIEEDVEE